MKYRVTIMKAAAALILLSTLASCAKHYNSDNKRPSRYHYRKAGRAW
jgi:hypothetical protein